MKRNLPADISEPGSHDFTPPCTTEDEEEDAEQVAVTLDGCRVLRDQNGRHDSEGSEEDLLQENNEISLITRAVIVSSHKMWRGREDRHLPSMAPSPPQEKERNRVEIQISIPSSYCTVQYPTSFFPSSFPQLYSFPRTPHSFLRTWLPFSAAADAASGCTHERGGEIEDTLLPPSLPPSSPHPPTSPLGLLSPPLSLSIPAASWRLLLPSSVLRCATIAGEFH